MNVCEVLCVDAFSKIPNRGNPAGVVIDGDCYGPDAMQGIAKAVGYNETVFVCSSGQADYRMRYFTPGHETDLCGHATIAAIATLCRGRPGRHTLSMETGAGILSVQYDGDDEAVKMAQAAPRFRDFCGDRAKLARAMGIRSGDLCADLLIEYGNTGVWTLLVPVRDEKTLAAMMPHNASFPDILKEIPTSSIHPFVVLNGDEGIDFLARHFSSPYSGTAEDPVTGTASGVMAAYAMRRLFPDHSEKTFVVSQGASMGRNGYVSVQAKRENASLSISISGHAVRAGKKTLRQTTGKEHTGSRWECI